MDDKDLFSYDNSGNLEETGEESFDLNSFSSHIEKEPVKGKKRQKKEEITQGTHFKNRAYPFSCGRYNRKYSYIRLFALCFYNG